MLGEQVKITAQLIHGQTDEHIWAETYDRDLRDVLALLGEIARTISDEIEISLRPQDEECLARVAALKALELDDQISAGHAALGWVRLFSGDWPGAGQSFEEALRLNPNHAMTIHGYADYLMLSGRLEESLVQVRRAQAIDPFTPTSNLPVPVHLYMMRRYDEAIAEAQELLKTDPNYPVGWLLTLIYWQNGMFQEALAEYRKTLTRMNDTGLLEALENGNSESGPRGAMRAMADEMAVRSKMGHVDPFKVSSTYAQAGEVDQAIEWLEKAVERSSPELIYVGLRPDFDLLRSDPRYEMLMQKFGLPNP